MRNVRRVAGDTDRQPSITNRSITEVCNTNPASSSSPRRSANAASLPAANNSAFARPGVPGSARVTTPRANTAAASDSEQGAQPPITAAARTRVTARSLGVRSLANTRTIRE